MSKQKKIKLTKKEQAFFKALHKETGQEVFNYKDTLIIVSEKTVDSIIGTFTCTAVDTPGFVPESDILKGLYRKKRKQKKKEKEPPTE